MVPNIDVCMFYEKLISQRDPLSICTELCIKVSGGRDFAKINEGHQNSQMFSSN